MFGRFFAAFAVCVLWCGSCHPLIAQVDLQNADIDPTEVFEIEPEEPEELEFPPELPEIDFWEYWDEEYFPVFGFAGVNPVLAQFDPVVPPPPDDEEEIPPVEEVPIEGETGGGNAGGGSSSGSADGLTPEIPAAFGNFSLLGVFSAIVGPMALALAVGLGLVVSVWICVLVWVWLRRVVRR